VPPPCCYTERTAPLAVPAAGAALNIEIFIKGIAAGLLIAAPVGPVGVLCVHRTLVLGRAHGLASGAGAATADALFAAVVAFGLHYVSDFLLNNQHWLRLCGGTLLVLLGIKNLLTKEPVDDVVETPRNLPGDCASAFFLTATNPVTILSFLGVFAALGAGAPRTWAESGALVAGVFAGSAVWWLVLTGGVGLVRETMEALFLRQIHIV